MKNIITKINHCFAWCWQSVESFFNKSGTITKYETYDKTAINLSDFSSSDKLFFNSFSFVETDFEILVSVFWEFFNSKIFFSKFLTSSESHKNFFNSEIQFSADLKFFSSVHFFMCEIASSIAIQFSFKNFSLISGVVFLVKLLN